MNRQRVLFVDDEALVLQGLTRMLRGMRKQWDMAFVSSGREALDLMDKEPFDVVVTDMRMPGMDGSQLLNEVRERYPKSARIILSGHADRELIIRSLTTTHQYLSKPCAAETLKATLDRVLSLHNLFGCNPIFESLISRIQALPSIPSLYLMVQEELRSSNTSVKRIAEIVAQDPAMTTKMLQLVNSAFFGVPQHISNPEVAVNMLGLDTVQALVFSAHVFRQFDKLPKYMDLDDLWHHGTLVGTLAKRIAKAEAADKQAYSDASVAGMLHDVGRLVLLVNLPEEYERLHGLAESSNTNLFELERLEWGTTHAEVGAYLLGLWGLPESVVKAVALHHGPVAGLDNGFSVATAVYAANAFARELTADKNAPVDKLEVNGLNELYVRWPAWRELCAQSMDFGRPQ